MRPLQAARNKAEAMVLSLDGQGRNVSNLRLLHEELLDSGDNLLAHWIHGRHDKMSSVINTRLGFGRYEQRLAPQLPIAHPLRVAPRRTKGTVAPLPPYIQPVATLGDSRWWGPLPNAKRRKSCHGACLVAAAIQLAQAVATNGSSGPPPVTPSFSVC